MAESFRLRDILAAVSSRRFAITLEWAVRRYRSR
jgi:hypothetical protein